MSKTFNPSVVIASALAAPTCGFAMIWLSFHAHQIIQLL
jgi:hypothetical protein